MWITQLIGGKVFFTINKMADNKVKTTILIDKTLKKLAQVYAIQNETSLGNVIEQGLRALILDKAEK